MYASGLQTKMSQVSRQDIASRPADIPPILQRQSQQFLAGRREYRCDGSQSYGERTIAPRNPFVYVIRIPLGRI